MATATVDPRISAYGVEMLVWRSSPDRRTKIKTRFKNGKKLRVVHKLDQEQVVRGGCTRPTEYGPSATSPERTTKP